MFDFHVHTGVSFDSQANAGEMLDAAAASGVKVLCFTDHCDYHTDPLKKPDAFTLESYRAAYDGLNHPIVTVKRGIEFGMTEWNMAVYQQTISAYPYDFVIGSVHEVDGLDPYFPEYWDNGDVSYHFRRYLEHTLRCVQLHDGFDVLGHLTYVCKSVHNPSHSAVPFQDNMELTDAIMQELVKKGIGMEINTSGVDRAGDFLPSAAFLRRFKELGGQIVTVGSDAHDPSRVGQYVPQALELLKDIFGYVCTFSERRPIFHKL